VRGRGLLGEALGGGREDGRESEGLDRGLGADGVDLLQKGLAGRLVLVGGEKAEGRAEKAEGRRQERTNFFIGCLLPSAFLF
jgi:hypothetical protein